MATIHVPLGKEMRIVGPAKLDVVSDFERFFSQTDFALQNPPTLASIAPTTAVAGTGAAFTLTATGTNFISGISKIFANGAELPTTWLSATSMTAPVNPANAAAGTVNVTVRTYSHETAPRVFTFT